MIYHNTQMRSTRNLMIFGQHVALLRQYSKTTGFAGQDKLIPHSLDAVTGDILIQDLAIARPFAQLAAKICFGDDEITQLYKDLLFVNFDRMFTSEHLSSIMSHYSQPRLQYSLTINSWRHIQTAWKRKFRCASEEILEQEGSEDVDALQAGHTRATENRIYGLSTNSLSTSAAEDILPLFLQASTSWQERCGVVPGGQFISYYQARSSAATTPNRHGQLQSKHDAMVDDIVNKLVEHLTLMFVTLVQTLLVTLLQAIMKSGSGQQKKEKKKGKGEGEGEGEEKETQCQAYRNKGKYKQVYLEEEEKDEDEDDARFSED